MKQKAFPKPNLEDNDMDLRDWFAGQIVKGIVSNSEMKKEITNSEVADIVYGLANKMMERREINEH